eukprot:XP_014053133.1 PREDICTED: haptoglobin-like [Salmo salar]
MWSSLVVLLAASCVCLEQDKIKIKIKIKTKSIDEMSDNSDLRFRRMVGGTLAPHVPWQAMVYLSKNVMNGGFAGGALISDRWVLTAGRNLFVRKSRQDTQGKEPIIPKVYLGITRYSQANDSKEVAVEKVVLHPGFQSVSDWDNDLALIQLKEPFTLSEAVMPIPLPERGEDLAEAAQEKGIITGWGWGVHFTPAESLKHLVLPVASHSFYIFPMKSES